MGGETKKHLFASRRNKIPRLGTIRPQAPDPKGVWTLPCSNNHWKELSLAFAATLAGMKGAKEARSPRACRKEQIPLCIDGERVARKRAGQHDRLAVGQPAHKFQGREGPDFRCLNAGRRHAWNHDKAAHAHTNMSKILGQVTKNLEGAMFKK